MKVKTFYESPGYDIEKAVQSWLDSHPNIKIHSTSHSEDEEGLINLIIFYTLE